MGLSAEPVAGDSGATESTRSLQAIVALGGIQALTMVAGLARIKILALLLGPVGVGIAGVIDQVVALVGHLGSLSLPLAAVKYLSRRKDEQEGRAVAQLYRAFFSVLLAASVVATALAVAIALWRPTALGEALAPYRVALVIGLLSVPVVTVVALERSVLATMGRHYQAAVIALCGGLALVGASYVGVHVRGLTGLYAGYLAVNFMLAVFLVAYAARSLRLPPAGGGTRQAVRALVREPGLVSFCTIIHLLTLVYPLAYLVARVTVLSHHGAVAAGLLAAAYGLALSLRLVLNQANALYLTPLVNRSSPKDERAAAVGDYARVLIVVVVVGVLAVVLFPEQWLALLYSSRFVEATSFVGAFMVAEAVLLVAGVYQALLIGFDDVRAHLVISTVAHLCAMLLTLLFVPQLGPLGVALAFMAANVLVLVLTLARLVRAHDAHAAVRPLWLFGVGVAALGAASWGSTVGAFTLPWRIATFGVASAAFLTLLTREERRWILAPWRRSAPGASA